MDEPSLAEQFASELRQLRETAGNPSFRDMARVSGRISYSALHDAVKGSRIPTWETTREFVRGCGRDETGWHEKWQDYDRRKRAPSDSAPVDRATRRIRLSRRGWHVLAVAATVLVAVALVAVVLSVRSTRTPTRPAGTAVPSFSAPVVTGDRFQLVADVTVPAGSRVRSKEVFVKTWDVRNDGVVPWRDRFLQRQKPTTKTDQRWRSYASTEECQTPERVAIGSVPIGQTVRISVPVTAMSTPGDCMIPWRITDGQWRDFFPGSRPLYLLVHVVD